jgi:ankyrin repeat protein
MDTEYYLQKLSLLSAEMNFWQILYEESGLDAVIASSTEINKQPENVFLWACREQTIETLQLLDNNACMNSYDFAFARACEYGNINAAIWLTLKKDINWNIIAEPAILMATHNGNLKIIKWLIELITKYNITIDIDNIFKVACFRNRIDIVTWLVNTVDDLDVHEDNEYIFRHACANNNLEIVSILLENYPEIDKTANQHEAWRLACANPNPRVMDYLAITLFGFSKTTIYHPYCLATLNKIDNMRLIGNIGVCNVYSDQIETIPPELEELFIQQNPRHFS